MSEEKVKSVVEPLIVIMVGMFALALNVPLGTYLVLAGVSLKLSTQLIIDAERTRASI